MEKACGVNTSEEEAVEGLRFGLTEVVYEWAKDTVSKVVVVIMQYVYYCDIHTLHT